MADFALFSDRYWMARNTVQLAVVEGRLDYDDGMRIKLSLRDTFRDATGDEDYTQAVATFNEVIEKYTERNVHAE